MHRSLTLFVVTTLLLVLSNSQYYCSVQNCESCSYYNFCGKCSNNYILMMNSTVGNTYCSQVNCTIDRCTTCYEDNKCEICEDGFWPNADGSCSDISMNCSTNCLSCDSSDNCSRCSVGYNLQQGRCLQNLPLPSDCMIGFNSAMCQVCDVSYVVSPSYSCSSLNFINLCSVQFCLECSSQNNTCSLCLEGYGVSNGICFNCQDDFCQSCSDNGTTCAMCLKGYTMMNDICVQIAYGCSVANCMYCAEGPELCGTCIAGYEVKLIKNSNYQVVGSSCEKIQSSDLSNPAAEFKCLIFGNIPWGYNSKLSTGCVSCATGFNNVGGYCMANFSSSISCNVENCQWCSMPNYCGKCNDGFYVRNLTGGVCLPKFSPILHCSFSIYSTCLNCQPQYKLSQGNCYSLSQNITCNTQNCQYCQENDKCKECMSGSRKLTNQTDLCTPICSVDNCFMCSDSIFTPKCDICNYGYYLNNEGDCITVNTADNTTINCSMFGNWCQTCNSMECVTCQMNYTVYNGQCCLTPAQNKNWCSTYASPCSDTCLSCQKGFMLLNNQCYKLPCQIENCVFCFLTNQCDVCKEGYTVNNLGNCQPYTLDNTCPDNCVTCDGNGVCNNCLSGYTIYQGVCVCAQENCLSCLGKYCMNCAYPAVSTLQLKFQSGELCAPYFLEDTLCNVANCAQCFAVNKCAQCAPGYQMNTNGICQKIANCPSNCQLCFNQNYCAVCMENYMPVGYGCSLISANYSCLVENCQLCSSSLQCSVCSFGYIPTINNTCEEFVCLSNCKLCFINNSCTFCNDGYYLSTSNECVPNTTNTVQCNISNCDFCQKWNGTEEIYCKECRQGFQVKNNMSQCVPQSCSVQNCQVCSSNSTWECDVCEQGYFINSYSLCEEYSPNTLNISCDVYNCLYCGVSNHCGSCVDGWLENKNLCLSEEYCTTPNCKECTTINNCVECKQGFNLQNSTFTCLSCNIDFCNLCQEANICSQCLGELSLRGNNTACACPPTYLTVNNTLCVCPDKFTQFSDVCYRCQMEYCELCQQDDACSTCKTTFEVNKGNCVCPQNTTKFNDTCFACVSFCSLCEEDNICSTCNSPFIVDSNQTCSCPDGFIFSDNTCVCPAGKYNNNNQTCDSCLQHCAECVVGENCSVCQQPFVLNNESLCVCPQTYVERNLNCTCDEGFTEFNFTCFQCNLSRCLSCSGTNECHQCASNFVLSSSLTCQCPDTTYTVVQDTCTCATGTTEFNNSCITCSLNFCTLCTLENKCVSCSLPFIVENDVCVCPPTYIQSGNTCICPARTFQFNSTQCQACPSNCSSCLSSEICNSCDTTYFLNQNSTCACNASFIVQDSICVCPLNHIEFQNFCYLCEVNYCNHCSADNVCGDCFTSFVEELGVCKCNSTFQIHNSKCVCPLNTLENNGTCITCTIEYCNSCSESNVCADCFSGFVVEEGGSKCNCPLSFVIVNNVCQCPAGQLAVDGSCVSCQVANCLTCASTTTCQSCLNTFVLSSNQKSCSCPDSTFIVQNNQCVCPTGKTILNDSTCVECNIDFCQLCETADVCSTCNEGFTKQNQTCICLSPFTIINSSCTCAAGSTQFQGQCIGCNITDCLQCQEENLCHTCFQSFININNESCLCQTGFTEFQNYCYDCSGVSYCAVCSSTNFCEQCQNTFTLNTNLGICACASSTTLFNGTCYDCPIESCSLCQQNNVCFSCDTNYTLTNNFCTLCAISNCTQCNIQNICVECQGGLSVSSNGSQCFQCNINNCIECSTIGRCAYCQGGLSLSQSQTECIVCNVSSCAVCKSENVCSECQADFSLNGNVCEACTAPCATCQIGTNQCLTCITPYSFDASFNGTCYTCSMPYCKSCNLNSLSVCQECVDGYQFPPGSSTCALKCTTNLCTSCNDPAICTACIQGYIPQGNGCEKCSNTPQCISCSSSNVSICTACNGGFYLNNGTCLSCSTNCQTCNSQGCTSFKASTGQIAVRIGNQIQPTLCDQGCELCSSQNPLKCSLCYSNFFLDNETNSCKPCPFPCKTCSSTNSSICLSCFNNAFLSNGSCQKCVSSSNCLTCQPNNLAVCVLCPYSYSLSSDGTCKLGCPNNCLTCSNSSFCTMCIEGYALSSGQCLPCLSNCKFCSSESIGECLSCGMGFFLNQRQVCQACVPFCQTCTEIACSSCIAGYTLTNNFTCILNCEIPCSTCSATNPSQCTSCLAGYSFDETTNACSSKTTCEGGCTVCPFGFILLNQACEKCNDSCARCSTPTSSNCTSCYPGKYLFENACVSCPEGCKTCSNSQNCLSCSSGFTLQTQEVSINSICIACESPCSQCIGNADTCLSCLPGFDQVGQNCVSSFHFLVELVFNVNPSDFYSNYKAILDSFISSVGSSNFKVVSMNSIVQGSTIMSSQLSTTSASNSNEATDQFNSLTSNFEEGKTFSGMEILSSKISAVGGNVNEDDSKNNLALILGLTIPLSILFIAIIVFCCVRQRNKSRVPHPTDEDTGLEMFEVVL